MNFISKLSTISHSNKWLFQSTAVLGQESGQLQVHPETSVQGSSFTIIHTVKGSQFAPNSFTHVLPFIVVNLLVITYLLTNVTTGQSVTAESVRSVTGPHCPHCQLSLYQADFLVEVVDEEHLHQHSCSEQGQPQVEDRQAGMTGSLTSLLLHGDSC